MKKIVLTKNAPSAIGPYSQAVEINGFLYISGQLGIEPSTGNLVDGGIEAETEQSMKNIGAILKEAKFDFDNVIKTTIFLKNMSDFAKVNLIYEKYFKSAFPARSTIQVAELPKSGLVEIEVIASK